MSQDRRDKKQRREGFWGGCFDLVIECGELLFNIIVWPIRILGRMLVAIIEGLD